MSTDEIKKSEVKKCSYLIKTATMCTTRTTL